MSRFSIPTAGGDYYYSKRSYRWRRSYKHSYSYSHSYGHSSSESCY